MQIGELVNLVKTFHSRRNGKNHKLALFNVSKASAEFILFTKLEKILPVFQSATEALAEI